MDDRINENWAHMENAMGYLINYSKIINGHVEGSNVDLDSHDELMPPAVSRKSTNRTNIRLTDDEKEWADSITHSTAIPSREILLRACVCFAIDNADDFYRYISVEMEREFKRKSNELKSETQTEELDEEQAKELDDELTEDMHQEFEQEFGE